MIKTSLTTDELRFIGVCILVKDDDDQLYRRDSVAREAIEKAIKQVDFIMRVMSELNAGTTSIPE